MIQIIGKGGFAREVASYIQRINGALKSDIVFAEFKEIADFSIGSFFYTVIAIGDSNVREKIYKENKRFIYDTLNFGQGTENIIGNGCIICPGTILTVNIVLGRFVIINLNCTVGHDCEIGDFTTIAPGANISGDVIIGKRCYICSNVAIREKITICDDVTIGAGGVVVKNITEPGTYVGCPARKIK